MNRPSLADAILEGCEKRPVKIQKALFDNHDGACVMGAAIIGSSAHCPNSRLDAKFPILAVPLNQFGLDSLRVAATPQTLSTWIVDQNNETDRSREDIAEQVRLIEKDYWRRVDDGP